MKRVSLVVLFGLSIFGTSMITTSFADHVDPLTADIGLASHSSGCSFFALDKNLAPLIDHDEYPTVSIHNDGTLTCVGSVVVPESRYSQDSADRGNDCVFDQGGDKIIYSSWDQNVNQKGKAVLTCHP